MTDTISQTKLNTLLERVCLPIDYLTQPIKPGVSLWDEPIRMCRQIEKESFLVDSIIIEARKNNAFFSGANSPRLYHAVLCRVYILLYYRHRDDKEYQSIVYPRLKANMGVYGSNLFNNINASINRVIELEEIARKAEAAKKRENANPKFSLPKLSRAELDELFDEYNKEKLFREYVLFYDRVIRPDDAKLDQAELWYTAKDIVRMLWHANYPETYIERIMNQFDTDLGYVGMAAPQYIMMCVYIMMRTVRDNRFADAIVRIESYMQNDNTDFHYLRQYMSSVKQWFDENRPFDDYDYVGTPPKQESETIALPDIERIRQQVTEEEGAKSESFQTENEELKAKIEDQQKENEQRESSDEIPDIKEGEDVLYNKVAYEFFIRLMENAGFDINNTGNKTNLGILWHMLTGKSADDLRGYCSKRDYVNVKTRRDIELLNKHLSSLGVNSIKLDD